MTKKRKIALIWADPYSGNLGVGALAYSALHILDRISEEFNFEYDLTIIGTKPGKQTIEIDGRCIYFTGVKGLVSLRSLLFKLREPWMFIKYFHVNYVLDTGAGDSYSDIYGEQRFEKLNFSKKFYQLLGAKQLLLPQTIGPFSNPAVKRKAIESIDKCWAVLTRDKQSFDYVSGISRQKRIFEILDMAFYLPYTKTNLEGDYIKVGIGVSALLWNGGYTGKNEFGLKMDYKELVRRIIGFFLQEKNVGIILVPHVAHHTQNIENDYDLSKAIEKEYDSNSITTSPFFASPIQAKNFISGLDFFTGARMHACIAAFSTGIPLFPLAYSRKFNGLFKDTLNYPYLGDMVNEDLNDIIQNLMVAFYNRESLRISIRNTTNTTVAQRYKSLLEHVGLFLA